MKQCQSVNENNQEKSKIVLEKLFQCVGDKTQITQKLQEAKTKLAIYELKRKQNLEQRIEKLKKLPVNDCDNYIFDDATIMLWNTPNSKD